MPPDTVAVKDRGVIVPVTLERIVKVCVPFVYPLPAVEITIPLVEVTPNGAAVPDELSEVLVVTFVTPVNVVVPSAAKVMGPLVVVGP